MSRKKESCFKVFLVEEGYILAFTLITVLSLFSYFWANDYFVKQSGRKVLGTSSVRGVWINGGNTDEVESVRSNFDEYERVPTQELYFDDQGRVLFSNNDLSISGIFTMKEFINDDVWKNLYIGDLNLKISNRQWVFESVVWDREHTESVMTLFKTDDRYLIVLHPSVTLTGREKRFWVFEYVTDDGIIKPISFLKSEEERVFIESSYVEILEKDGDIFIKFEREDPALLGEKEFELYRYDDNLVYQKIK